MLGRWRCTPWWRKNFAGIRSPCWGSRGRTWRGGEQSGPLLKWRDLSDRGPKAVFSVADERRADFKKHAIYPNFDGPGRPKLEEG